MLENRRQSKLTKLEARLITIAKNTQGRFTQRWISLSLLATLALATLIFTFLARSPKTPRLAFLDTAFCPSVLENSLPKGVNFQLIQNLETAKTICSLPLEHPMRHGDRVLLTYLKNLSPDIEGHEILLYGLFTLSGRIDAPSWLRANMDAMARGSQVIASAVAAPITELRSEVLSLDNHLLILASGQWGGRIPENQRLIPHEIIRNSKELKENVLVIGPYFLDKNHQEAYLDQTLLYSDLIQYSFAISEDTENQDTIIGSSYALAVATARMMNLCLDKLGEATAIKACLKTHSVSVKTVNGPEVFQY